MPPRPFSLTTPRGDADWRAGDDPFLVAENIEISSVELRNFIVPLTQARRVIREDIQERFLTETDPNHASWAEWAESYRPRAQRENVGKLRKTEKLFNAISDDNTYEIRTSGTYTRASTGYVALVGSNLPDYWEWHQSGTSRMPARPFMGMTVEAEALIYTIFDMHVEGSLISMVRKTGQPIVRAPHGASFATHFKK